MRRFLALFLTGILLLTASFTAAAEQPAQTPDYGSGTPWPDIDLDGVVTEDTPVSLKDDFALYVNKDVIPRAIPSISAVHSREAVSTTVPCATRSCTPGLAP